MVRLVRTIIIKRAESITDLNVFQIVFCCFNSDSPEFLYVALNSIRRRCSNAIAVALCFVCNYKNP